MTCGGLAVTGPEVAGADPTPGLVDVFPDRMRDADEFADPADATADLAMRLFDDELAAEPSCCCCPELAELTLRASPDLRAVPPPVPPVPHAVDELAILLMLVDDAVLLGIDDTFVGAASSPWRRRSACASFVVADDDCEGSMRLVDELVWRDCDCCCCSCVGGTEGCKPLVVELAT
jgi:hypothetical protein